MRNERQPVTERPAEKTARHSGVELLRVFALLLVVVSHVVQTLRSGDTYVPYSDFIVDASVATADPRQFTITLLSYFGVLGNWIFFICSAWFLLRSTRFDRRKWFFMIAEVWFVSVVLLAVTLVVRRGDISLKLLVNCLLPNTFATNWYVTCYLMFYPIHPILNGAIRRLSKKQLFRLAAALLTMYFGVDFIYRGLFFTSTIILWITVYFAMAYLQLYLPDFADSPRRNAALLLVGLLGYLGIAFAANALGLRFSSFRDQMLYWQTNCNPFMIAIAIALFNLSRRLTFRSRTVNYVAGLSLLVYIIHENRLLRAYFRPALWQYIYTRFGYDRLLLWVFALSAGVFLFALALSIAYDKTLRRFVRKAADRAYTFLAGAYLKLEARLLSRH